MAENPLRALPGVDRLVAALPEKDAGHARAVEAARAVLSEARSAVREGSAAPTSARLMELTSERLAAMERPSLRPVINASGVILQTNLGRAPLSEAAIAAISAVARDYSNLEYDLEAGTRGSRHEHVRELLRRTTGAEDGIVFNNNAAALYMVLNVFAQAREVVISRGQAVEIGGGFRIPDVLRQSGARLAEIGTTNRTYARDYASAVTPETAALLRVHTSNFRVIGFTAEPTVAELAAVAHEHNILLLDDLGSGCLIDTAPFGIEHEPTVQESLAAGADLAMFSGDKLLGGPQCGIVVGRTELIDRLRRHPLARALRVDKLTIAALNATLMTYANGRASDEIPVWRMVSADPSSIRRRATSWARAWGTGAKVVASRSMVGGGSLPGQGVPTWCMAIKAESADRLASTLRSGVPAIVGRIEEDMVLLDPRTVDPSRDRAVRARLTQLAL